MQPDDWARVTSRAEAQHGLVSTAQLRALEVPRVAIQRAVSRRLLIPTRSGVYRVGGVPPTAYTPLMAACLAGGAAVAASHMAAGWLHNIARIAPGSVELTMYHRSINRLDDVRCHRSKYLEGADLTSVRNIPVTSAARTIMDLAAVASAWLLPKLLDDVLRRQLCTPKEVADCVERIGGRGRAGTAFLRVLADERLNGQLPGDSDWEVKLYRALTAAGLRPVQQHQVAAGRRVFLIDLAYPDHKVGVEFQGWDAHGTRSAMDHDAERELLLTGEGWLLVPATSRTRSTHVIRAVQVAISRQGVRRDRDLDSG